MNAEAGTKGQTNTTTTQYSVTQLNISQLYHLPLSVSITRNVIKSSQTSLPLPLPLTITPPTPSNINTTPTHNNPLSPRRRLRRPLQPSAAHLLPIGMGAGEGHVLRGGGPT